MKKRIVCVLLTLIMLLSLVPVGASAASHTVSEAAITVLKQMTTLETVCYHYSGSEFRTGYGTVCEEDHHFKYDATNRQNVPDNSVLNDDGTIANEHTITEKNADIALRKALTTFDEKVNAFASANGLSLTQNQHDALVVFSYDAGTEWMSGTGVLKSVIINKGSATELLNAMALWSSQTPNGNTTTLSRRKVEANMYMNGIYSNSAPSSYGYAIYDPNGGDIAQANYNGDGNYTYYYDINTTMAHPAVPTKNGAKFLGWYIEEAAGSDTEWVWYPNLNRYCNGETLVAQWQASGSTTGLDVYYQLHEDHLASKKVFKNVGDDEEDEDLTEEFDDYLDDHNDLFYVDCDYIDSLGTRWSHLASYIDGWVMVGAATNESTTDSNGTVIATATVTCNGYLNLRQEAGTDATIVGALAKNDTVNIYEIKTVNGHQWGRSKSGWLCLTYTRVIMKDDVTVSDEGRLAYTFTGTAYDGTEMDEVCFNNTQADLTLNNVVYGIPVHEEPGDNNNYVSYRDPDNAKRTLVIANGTAVTLTNLAVYKNSETWAKVTWMNNEWEYDDDGEKDWITVKRSGWVKLVAANGEQPDDGSIYVDSVKYTVVADSVSVRNYWGDSSSLIMSLNKGVQVKVDLVALVGENMWGRVKVKRAEHVEDYITGYVNLASKYFSRDDAPVVEDDDDSLEDLVATVINTDSLKVRKYGATYGQQIGTLKRGTTVAVWEYNGKGWYKVDSNKNGVYDYDKDGWCSEKYLDVHKNTVSSTVTDSTGNSYTTDGTGKGIVANTYSGVNVRTGPSTAYATNGKLLPGTVVEILETKNGGKWGRVTQGWISMDYVTMISYNEVEPELPEGTTSVGSYDEAAKTTTTAVYTGVMAANAEVLRNPTKNDAEKIRNAVIGENVTIYELAKVTEVVQSDNEVVGNVTTNTTVTTTTYWARINDGWVENPETCLQLNALDEKVHTQTSVDKLNVRKGYDAMTANESGTVFDVLIKGDQVTVTALDIIGDKVWGRIDTNEGTGWIRLDYMSEGAVVVKTPVQNNTTTNTNQVILGNTSSTGGYVTNSSGYRYTGKIYRANEVNVRANPSTSAAKTTALKNGAALVIYETTVAENMAWGRCDAGWVYLYYVDLTPVVNGAIDARVVYNDNTIIYSDVNCTSVAGTYSRMSTIDIYEIVGKMARTDLGWVNTDNLL